MEPVRLNAAVVKLTPSTSNDTDTLPAGGSTVRVLNVGSTTVFVATGKDSTLVAVVDSSCPIAAGTCESFTIDQSHRYVAAICSTGSSTVYVQRSDGI